MFLEFPLKNFYDTDKMKYFSFSERQKSDLNLIVENLKQENIPVINWSIYEISDLKNDSDIYVYCLNDILDNEVFIYVSEIGELEPHYFKLFDNGDYKSVKDKTIKEAIIKQRMNSEKYYNFYEINWI